MAIFGHKRDEFAFAITGIPDIVGCIEINTQTGIVLVKLGIHATTAIQVECGTYRVISSKSIAFRRSKSSFKLRFEGIAIRQRVVFDYGTLGILYTGLSGGIGAGRKVIVERLTLLDSHNPPKTNCNNSYKQHEEYHRKQRYKAA